MEKIVLVLFILVAQYALAQNSVEDIAKTNLNGNYKKEINLKTEKNITGIGFSIVVPKGWSYLNIDKSKKPMEQKVDGKVTRTSTAEVLMTPTSRLRESEIYLGVHNFFPKAPDVESIYARHKNDKAKLITENWNGRMWQVLEYKLTYQDENKKNVSKYNLYATTHLKDRDLAILAGTPWSSKREKFRPQFELIMKSVNVIE